MITSLTIGSLTLEYATGYVLGDTAGFDFSEIRTDVQNRGNADGARLGSFLYGKRSFSINGEIWGDNPTDYETKRRALEKALLFDTTNGYKTLQIETRGGLSLQVDVVLRNVDIPYKKHDMARGMFQIQFDATYPYIEAQSLTEQDLSPATGGGFSIPIAVPFSIAVGGTGSVTVTNNGNAPAYPTFIINGGISSPSVQNVTTQKTLSFTNTLTSAINKITVDTYNQTAVDENGNSTVNTASGTFWTLEPGDNEIAFFGNSANGSANANVSFRDSYIGL